MKKLKIAAYTRSAVDLDDKFKISSTEMQRNTITEYVNKNFSDTILDFFEDPNCSGLNFNRTNYQKLIKKILNGNYDILIMNDLSRFSRCFSKSFEELKKIKNAGVRIIIIDQNLDLFFEEGLVLSQFKFL